MSSSSSSSNTSTNVVTETSNVSLEDLNSSVVTTDSTIQDVVFTDHGAIASAGVVAANAMLFAEAVGEGTAEAYEAAMAGVGRSVQAVEDIAKSASTMGQDLVADSLVKVVKNVSWSVAVVAGVYLFAKAMK